LTGPWDYAYFNASNITMRYLAICCCILLWMRVPAQQDAPTALVHANIIDVENGSLLKDQTILIANGLIRDIFPTSKKKVLPGYTMINAGGKYLIPGLIDSHVHLHNYFRSGKQHLLQAPLNVFLYYGITGFREASGSVYTKEMIALRDSINSGKLLGPRMYVSGIATSTNLKKLEAGSYTDVVRKFSEMGVDGIKVKFTSFEETKEIIDAAHRLHLPVYGHTTNPLQGDSINIPGDFTPGIVDYGIDGVMHTGGYPPVADYKNIPAAPPADQWEALWLYMDALWLFADTASEQALIQKMITHHTWLEPTLTVEQLVTARRQYKDDPALSFSLAGYEDYFSGMPQPVGNQLDTALLAFKRKQRFVKKFHDAGGLVLAGTDHLFGNTLHKELELMVEAGLSPAEALKAATCNNAKALGWLKTLGTVSKGKNASLVLLDKNPLEDIRNTRSINLVIVNGKVLGRKQLDGMMKEAVSRVSDE
jgi:imidazolonepropionase-like amidohydrolase